MRPQKHGIKDNEYEKCKNFVFKKLNRWYQKVIFLGKK